MRPPCRDVRDGTRPIRQAGRAAHPRERSSDGDLRPLGQVELPAMPGDVAGCAGVPRERAARWVHLRMRQTCGKVGCCDASPNRHGHACHAREADHPVLRSVEPGRGVVLLCVIDEVAFESRVELPKPRTESLARAITCYADMTVCDEARRPAPHHDDHRRRAQERRVLRRTCSGCGWSRRRSTSTRPTPTTCTSATSGARPARSSPGSSSRAPRAAGRARG